MHTAGIPHYDLTAHNIIVNNDNPKDLVIVDFERARDDTAKRVELQPAVMGFICCGEHLKKLKEYSKQEVGTIKDWYLDWPKNWRPDM